MKRSGYFHALGDLPEASVCSKTPGDLPSLRAACPLWYPDVVFVAPGMLLLGIDAYAGSGLPLLTFVMSLAAGLSPRSEIAFSVRFFLLG